MKTEFSEIINKRRFFKCVCDNCEKEFTRRSDKKQFDTCGDCSLKIAGEKRKTHGENNSNSRLHVTWSNMKRRCLNPTPKEKRNYQSKGITICDEWHSYINFKEWALSNGYSDDLCIDRIDNDKGYHPENCRFVNYSIQNANKGITSKNTTGFIGVYKSGDKYRSCIDWEGERINLGYFICPIEAAKERDSYIVENELPHTLNF